MRIPVRALVYVIAILLVFAFGVSGTYVLGHYGNGFSIKINSVLDAAYFTVVTMSTIGYGDIVPVTGTARVFVMALIVSGLGVFLSAITLLSSEIINTRIDQFSGRLSGFERRLLKNHVILVGTDTVNMQLAEKLKEKNVRFVMISSSKERVEFCRELGYRAYLADETDQEHMHRFEFGKAKSIIIDMRDKARMVYAILVVRNLAKSSKIVTIAHNKEEERNVRSLGAGIGIINPPDLVSNILSRRILEIK